MTFGHTHAESADHRRVADDLGRLFWPESTRAIGAGRDKPYSCWGESIEKESGKSNSFLNFANYLYLIEEKGAWFEFWGA